MPRRMALLSLGQVAAATTSIAPALVLPHAAQVLPVLRDKHDEGLLKELLHRWNNHKVGGRAAGCTA